MSLTDSIGCWLSLILSLVPLSCLMSFTVSSSSMALLHVHHCLPWFLAVSHFLSQCLLVAAFLSQSFMITGCLSHSLRSFGVAACLFEFQGVAACLSLSHMLACSLSQFHGVAACLSNSPMFARFLSISLRSHWVSTGLYLSLPIPCSCCMSLIVSHGCWPTDTVSPIPWSCCLSFTFSYCCWLPLQLSPSAMELLHVSHSLI